MGKDAKNLLVKSEFEMTDFSTILEERPNMLAEDITGNQVTNASYKRFSWDEKMMSREKELEGSQARRNSSAHVIPSRYLSGSAGSCHDLCKLGHKHNFEVKMKAPAARSVMLRTQSDRKVVLSRTQSERRDATSRTQCERRDVRVKTQSERRDVVLTRSKSERRDVPKVELSTESSKKKSIFRRLSLPAPRVENKMPLQGNEIKGVKKPGNSHKKLLVSSSLKGKDEPKPACPVKSASCKSKPPVMRALTMDARKKSSHKHSLKVKQSIDVQERMLHVIEPSSEDMPINAEGRSNVGTIEKTNDSCFTKSALPIEPSSEDMPINAEGRSNVGTIEKTNDSCFTKSVLPTLHRPIGHTDTDSDVTSESSNLEGRLLDPKAEQSMEPKAKVEKPEEGQTREKGSSTWKVKFKKAALSVLSSGSMSPKILNFRKPESTSENQNVEVGKVVLKSMEGKDLSNVTKETAREPIKSGKNTVKTLVGAFEALISLGDRKSLVEASAS